MKNITIITNSYFDAVPNSLRLSECFRAKSISEVTVGDSDFFVRWHCPYDSDEDSKMVGDKAELGVV